jgi:hypothetical protein
MVYSTRVARRMSQPSNDLPVAVYRLIARRLHRSLDQGVILREALFRRLTAISDPALLPL